MTAIPQTRIPAAVQGDLTDHFERFLTTEANLLVGQGLYPRGARGFALARLEVSLVVGAHDTVESSVAAARREGATWDDIARATGLSSRGSAARRFAGVRRTAEQKADPATGRLNRARVRVQDDFRTLISDVENELRHYEEHLRGARILLPCDDVESAFWHHLTANFEGLGLRSVTATAYRPGGGAFVLTMTADGTTYRPLAGTGDFASDEVAALFDDCDLVITNPPFSRFQALVELISARSLRFLVMGGVNAIAAEPTWTLHRAGRVGLGVTGYGSGLRFRVPDSYHSPTVRLDGDGHRLAEVAVWWYTNVPHEHRRALEVTNEYADWRHPRYDNLDAIEVPTVAGIPGDYDGLMGVPVTYLSRHDPTRFDIVGLSRELAPGGTLTLDGERVYQRVLIRAVSQTETSPAL